jgi:hypothetical protein
MVLCDEMLLPGMQYMPPAEEEFGFGVTSLDGI